VDVVLEHIPAGAGLQGVFYVPALSMHRSDQDAEGGGLLRKAMGQFNAVHSTERNVNDGQVGVHVGDFLQHLLAGIGLPNHRKILIGFEKVLVPISNNGMVVDENDAKRGTIRHSAYTF